MFAFLAEHHELYQNLLAQIKRPNSKHWDFGQTVFPMFGKTQHLRFLSLSSSPRFFRRPTTRYAMLKLIFFLSAKSGTSIPGSTLSAASTSSSRNPLLTALLCSPSRAQRSSIDAFCTSAMCAAHCAIIASVVRWSAGTSYPAALFLEISSALRNFSYSSSAAISSSWHRAISSSGVSAPYTKRIPATAVGSPLRNAA